MKNRLLGSLATFFTAAGLSFAEPPASAPTPLPNLPTKTAASEGTPYTELFHENCCDQPTRTWFGAEGLLWKIKNHPLPVPLATGVPEGGAPSPNPGALGDPNTVILIGGDPLDTKWRTGARFTAGAWLDCNQRFGIEGSGFFLDKQTERQSVSSSGAPGSAVVGFVFFDATGQRTPDGLPGPAFQPNSIPGVFSGGTSVAISNALYGAEVNGLYNLVRTCNATVNFLAGGRYLDLHEDLTIRNNQTSIDTTRVGVSGAALDEFDARNRFYGGQVGLQGQVNFGRAFFSAAAKVAVGSVHQSVDTSGISFLDFAGVGPTFFPSGIYAQASNIGHHGHDEITFVQEATAKVGFNVTKNLTAFAGYNFLFINDVLRPGNQVDRVINLDQSALFGPGVTTGPARPLNPLADSTFWAQGATFGLEFRW